MSTKLEISVLFRRKQIELLIAAAVASRNAGGHTSHERRALETAIVRLERARDNLARRV